MSEIIKLEKIKKSYFSPAETVVLPNLNMSFDAGGLNSIIGQSGSGKTTLMNILGLLDKPTEGEVYINGESTSHLTSKDMARIRNQTIGFIFQFHYLLPEYSVLENVLMPSLTANSYNKKAVARAKELLEIVGLKDKINYSAMNISGGQQQRVAIARALMNEPKIILADEPTGNLDTDTSKKVFELFCQINKELSTTFVIITHDDRIAKQTDRIIELQDGRIVSDKLNADNKRKIC